MTCDCGDKCHISKEEEKSEFRGPIIRFAIAAVLMAVGLYLDFVVHAEQIIQLAVFVAAYIICGYTLYIECVHNLAEGEIFDEVLLTIIATLGAFAIGAYPEAVAVMLFFNLGELFEDYAVDKSKRSVTALLDIVPDEATVVRDGKQIVVSPDEVEVGETIAVRPGERVPLDARIIQGFTSLDTVALTGESVPRSVGVGSEILSGMVNLTSNITAEVIRPHSESAVSRIMRMIEESSVKKARTERFITVFAKYYTPIVCLLAFLVAAIPIFAFGLPSDVWIYRALTLLVVSCPCALVISVPMGFFCGIGCASKNGILVKGGNYLEMLAKADTIVFDKTGTLTEGTFEVKGVSPEGMGERELVELAAKAEYYSDHPISLSIKRNHGKELDPAEIGRSEVVPGRGVRTEVGEDTVHIGNVRLMNEIGIDIAEAETVGQRVHVASGGKYRGSIEVSDSVKADSSWMLGELKRMGIDRTVMLTGDNAHTANAVGKGIGIDRIHADLLPEDKLKILEEVMLSSKGSTAFVGDGINDSPSLARADVGIAMGGIGSDAAIEAADIVLVNDAPSGVSTAVKISRKTMRVVKQNIVFALGVKAVIIVLAIIGIAGMPIAIFGDVGVSIIAILNAMRCLSVKTGVPKDLQRQINKSAAVE